MKLFSLERWLYFTFIFYFSVSFAASASVSVHIDDDEEFKSQESRESWNTISMDSVDVPVSPTFSGRKESGSCLECICSPFVCILLTVLRVATCNYCCDCCCDPCESRTDSMNESISSPVIKDEK